ncbi:pyridoxal phosphate-dependent decarboxylase family protein [Halostagnicola kamekurae]|uniref:L-2,4-diaminobutyrate decarboxylase n=1 Tax=Halostagnicola kamekurae TaxID=619731 RepID=A0A1I6U823_9EURY|nr:aspartate aminotransferase family protein [Halostagnicola kamekurae]SFS97699.1 L-2,4-diaminobutyrate decarboxylase [Halostagnicola kamekurae]
MSSYELGGPEDDTSTDAAARSDVLALAERSFLGTPTGNDAYAAAMDGCREAVLSTVGDTDEPYAGTTYAALRETLDRDTLPETGNDLEEVLDDITTDVLAKSVFPSDDSCIAHLHCPPMIPGLAAEALLSALNQSLDSFDQSPAGTVIEERLIGDLASLFDLGADADGVVTTGGTQSNFQGLLVARERYVRDEFDRSAAGRGLPPEAESMRVLTSADAHFTVAQAAAQIGLGEDAVVAVPTDDRHRIDPDELAETLDRLKRAGERPFALVGTAGTTDFGSVDPLDTLADLAEDYGLWYHVDAALGGALAVSERHVGTLDGIERADSLAVDFHKLLFQPIACGAFLLADKSEYDLLSRNAAYLNPETDSVPNLVSKSVQTTRRFDALKPYVAFRTLGREGMASLIDRTIHLADRTAAMVRSDPAMELACAPTINVVTFRYVPQQNDSSSPKWVDRVNRRARDRLFTSGDGVVARTEVDGRAYLKVTLMNPQTTVDDIREVLLALKGHAARAAAQSNARDISGGRDTDAVRGQFEEVHR